MSYEAAPAIIRAYSDGIDLVSAYTSKIITRGTRGVIENIRVFIGLWKNEYWMIKDMSLAVLAKLWVSIGDHQVEGHGWLREGVYFRYLRRQCLRLTPTNPRLVETLVWPLRRPVLI